MIDNMEQLWNELCLTYTDDTILVNKLFTEIKNHYTSPKRHYHNLNHIYSMLEHANKHKDKLKHYDIICFSIWYHDIIYSSSKHDNEEKSADFAVLKLRQLNINSKHIETCKKIILSTKEHTPFVTDNNDNKFLLDFDLAILGQDWGTYRDYSQKIRKEYIRYPNFMYKKGRKKALQHFLERKRIYHTKEYYDKLEQGARNNITKEISLL